MKILLRMPIALVLMIVPVFAGGCAMFGAQGELFTKPNPVEGKAVVVLYRPSAFSGNRVYYHVAADDKELVTITNGGYFDCVLEPGEHTFKVREYVAGGPVGAVVNTRISPSREIPMDFQSEKVYYIRMALYKGDVDLKKVWDGIGRVMQDRAPKDIMFTFEMVDEKEALEELKDLKRFDPGSKEYWI